METWYFGVLLSILRSSLPGSNVSSTIILLCGSFFAWLTVRCRSTSYTLGLVERVRCGHRVEITRVHSGPPKHLYV